MAGLDRPRKRLILILLIATMIFLDDSLLNLALAETPACYDLLVVGPESYRAILQCFLDFKAAQGINTKFLPIERFNMNATGQSIVERLHEFVAEEYRQSGIKYLLLIGTYEQVPTKYVYSPSDENGLADFNYKPSDWYYGVPDWNDSEVGLLGGNIPRVAVGRLPVRNEEELGRVIQKIIRAEADLQQGLFLILNDQSVNAEALLNTLGTYRPVRMNMTSITLHTSFFDNIAYLVTITHGNPGVLFTRTPEGEFKALMTSKEAGEIGENYAIHYMAACFSGALDLEDESIARVLVTSAGGPALVIASSRTEWSENPILPAFWKHFFNTGDVGRSFVKAVESYLLDTSIFSSSKPSFSQYNFYLNKVIYGDVSWRIKDPGDSVMGAGILSNPSTHAENVVKDLSNANTELKRVTLGEKFIVPLLALAFSGCTLAAGRKACKRSSGSLHSGSG